MSNELNNLLDTAAIFRYHRNLIQQHGVGTTDALGWLKPEGQIARFEVLSKMADFNNHSVLDVGCGHADLFTYLKKLFPTIRYYGLEQIPELLEVAAKRFTNETDFSLLLGNFLQSALPCTDYILASGTFNYPHQNENFIYAAIDKLYNNCRLGFGFNLLNSGVHPNGLLAAYHPQDILAYCKKLSVNTFLNEGYLKGDFTVFIYK